MRLGGGHGGGAAKVSVGVRILVTEGPADGVGAPPLPGSGPSGAFAGGRSPLGKEKEGNGGATRFLNLVARWHHHFSATSWTSCTYIPVV